jgi:GT2 family glycosyltransferase
VCDNDSADGSPEAILDWAQGTRSIEAPSHERLVKLVENTGRPDSVARIARATAEAADTRRNAALTLIDNGGNLGFAAGNNVGLRFALNQPDMTHVWLLNNDTLVDPDCLANMVARIAQETRPAVCGSIIHFFDQPEILQAIGGNCFNHRTGTAGCSQGRYLHEDESFDLPTIEQEVSYLSGCSMVLPRAFLTEVGLMSEEYFLYYEEIDWFTRADHRFTLCVAEDAHLYHREGGSIGSSAWQRPASPLSDFHMFRSRLIYMRKFQPKSLYRAYINIGLIAVRRALAGHYKNAAAIIALLLGRNPYSPEAQA